MEKLTYLSTDSYSLLVGDCLREADRLFLPSHPGKSTLQGGARSVAPQNDLGGEGERFRHKLDAVRMCRNCYLWLQVKLLAGTLTASATARIKIPILSIFLSSSFKQHLLYC